MKTDIDNIKKSRIIKFILIVIILTVITILLMMVFNSKNNEDISYSITLFGDKYIKLNIGEDYIEPGFIATDSNNNDLSKQVVVTNNINFNQVGIYEIIYELKNKKDYRYVEIISNVDKTLTIELQKNTEIITNQDVIVQISVIGETFSYLVLPDSTKIPEKEVEYHISQNGSYLFEAYNNENEIFSKEIVIDNIDKEIPIGTCEATLNNKNTIIKVDASDNNLINYNYYDDSKFLSNSNDNNYIVNYRTTNIIIVDLVDEAENKNTINCKVIDNRFFDVIKPNNNENIIYNGESETLKFYITKKGSYYLTYVWARNPYMQLNKFDSPEYGVNLYTPKNLLSKANTKYNLTNKLMLGFNASGFYLKETYDASSVSKYSKYDKTSVGTIVITDGKVIRNAYDKAYKTWYTIGINKENKMLVFTDLKTETSNEINNKKVWANSVINSGIRNTFTFAAPIILNGKKTGITTSMPGGYNDSKGLQMICQINDNNFLLFTSTNATRNSGITEFLNHGCQTAMNLDGGGSVGLLYKAKGTNEITKVVGGGRALPEVGYFTE